MAGETCLTCERPRCTAGLGACEREGKECHGGIDCLAAGYERSQEALAAARRECEGLRAALTKIGDECSFMLNRDIPWVRHVVAEALAAPADGEEGKQ